MLLNIMYYDLSNQTKTSENLLLRLGPLKITPQQIGIGIIVELLTFVPSIFIVQFFRRIRPRQEISPIENALMKIKSSSEKLNSIPRKKKTSGIYISMVVYFYCLYVFNNDY